MLISNEDLARIDRIDMANQDDADVRWLCATAKRLACQKVSEGKFPEYLGLLNQSQGACYVMRHAENVSLVREVNATWPRIEHLISCETTDAVLGIRPYVQLESPRSEDLLRRLERIGKFTVHVDKDVLSTGPLAEILADLDGYGVHRNPFIFQPPKDPEKGAFASASLSADHKEAFRANFGVLFPGNVKVTVQLDLPPDLGDDVKLSIGLVMARYTTRGIPFANSINVRI